MPPDVVNCPIEFSSQQFATLVDVATEAINDDDPVAFKLAWQAANSAVPCLATPISKEPWGRLLYGMAVVQHAADQPWTVYIDAALATDPGLARSYGPPEIRNRPPPPPLGAGDSLPLGTRAWLDGTPIDHAPFLSGLHVAQRKTDLAWDNRVLTDAPFPADWVDVADPPKNRRRPGFLGAGIACVVAGSAAGAGTYAAAMNTGEAGSAEQTSLTAGNTLGWTTTLVGAGLVVAWGARL